MGNIFIYPTPPLEVGAAINLERGGKEGRRQESGGIMGERGRRGEERGGDPKIYGRGGGGGEEDESTRFYANWRGGGGGRGGGVSFQKRWSGLLVSSPRKVGGGLDISEETYLSCVEIRLLMSLDLRYGRVVAAGQEEGGVFLCV